MALFSDYIDRFFSVGSPENEKKFKKEVLTRVLSYEEQTLTEPQRLQAQQNIGIYNYIHSPVTIGAESAQYASITEGQVLSINLLLDSFRNGYAGAAGTHLIGDGINSAATWKNTNVAIGNNAMTANYLQKWNSSGYLRNSLIYDNGTNVGIGMALPTETLSVLGAPNTTDISWVIGAKQTANPNTTDPFGTGIKLIQGIASESHKWSGIAAVSEGYYANTSGLALYATKLERVRISGFGNVGIGLTVPTAVLHLKAGTATAGKAPFKFTSGTLLTTPEVGAIEFLTDKYYATITTGAARKTFAFLESPVFTGVIETPTMKIVTGATVDYIWKCSNIDGSGAWSVAPTSSQWTTGANGLEYTSGNIGVGASALASARIYGITTSNIGVHGVSTLSYGVYGVSSSSVGVNGLSSTNYGVYGSSTSSVGVFGSSSTGSGVFGSSSEYIGVYGSSSTGVGVYGNSTSHVGVSGYSSTSYGVYGKSGSNYAAYFDGTAYMTKLIIGTMNFPITDGSANQFLKTDGAGGVGWATISASQWTDDAYGITYTGGNIGVGASSINAAAIFGSSTSNIGVHGYSSTSYGVSGVSTSSAGVFGSSTSSTGVYGLSSTSYAIYGSSSSYIAVYGKSTSSYGIYGNSSSGVGVYGYSSTSYGVYGQSVSNYGGYFTGLGVNIAIGVLAIGGTTRISATGVFTPSNGITGTWTTTDGKTITATKGIITAIV